MQLKYYQVDKLRKEILNIIGRYLDLKSHRVFFFGSRVLGRGQERSDIDIGIDGSDVIPYVTMARIREEIDSLSTLYKIEIVDYKNVSPEFREVALQQIEIISN